MTYIEHYLKILHCPECNKAHEVDIMVPSTLTCSCGIGLIAIRGSMGVCLLKTDSSKLYKWSHMEKKYEIVDLKFEEK